MRLAELPAYLQMLAVRAGEAAIPAADAMGEAYQSEVKTVLTRMSHERGTRTPSPPGEPPAMESGDLAGSVTMVPATTPVIATSSVSPHRVYDWVQEYGATIHAHGTGFMHFFYEGERFERTVHIPERSYVRSTVTRMIASGELTAAAAEAFYRAMWG
jgi:hypothetical protein